EAGPGIHLDWLWKTWAEHRIPLAKLIWKAVLEHNRLRLPNRKFSDGAGVGRPRVCNNLDRARDERPHDHCRRFFPLAILNFGQAQVFLWLWQVNHVLAPITATLLLSILALHGNDLQRERNRTAFRVYLASQMPHDSAQLSHVWSTTFIIQVAPTEDLSPLRSSK